MNIRISNELLTRIHDAAYMQRWNDQIRPVELTELDKQAHKMIIAYMLGKFEEENGKGNERFNWIDIIEGGIFEFLQRLILTDLKPQVFYRIKENETGYAELNDWVYQELKEAISPLGEEFCRRYRAYFLNAADNINRKILGAAHFHATNWEFDIIQHANPRGYGMGDIEADLQARQEEYCDVRGVKELALHPQLRSFANLCGLLRFQLRWNHVYRVPKTSVLGHMLLVAMVSYLFSLQIGACQKRCVNNYFTGLFHDLPEALTRDIISPVKHSVPGLDSLIKEYEKEQMEKEVYGLIPDDWHRDMKMFTENEFESVIDMDGRMEAMSSDDISRNFNQDRFNPRDGELVKAVDTLAAFMEAYLAVKSGISSRDLEQAQKDIKTAYRRKTVAGINFGEIYAGF
ncbi:MAG: HD domain-containing protein [Dehalococcoidia bacterium]|nr:HD domain-containing protein [Dehalococcoidia bacterium]